MPGEKEKGPDRGRICELILNCLPLKPKLNQIWAGPNTLLGVNTKATRSSIIR